MTTRDLKTMKENILREIRNAKAEILKAFLHTAKQLQEHLELLDKEGIDRDKYICIKGNEEWEDISYSTVDRYYLISVLALLRQMKEDEKAIVTDFELITDEEKKFLMDYEEYFDMEKMEDTYNALKSAEEELEYLIL